MRITRAQARALGLLHLFPAAGPKPKRTARPAPRPPLPEPPREPHGPGHWVMEIPGWTPTKDNDLVYRPWWLARRRKQHDAEIVGQAALACGVPRAAGRRRVTLTVRNRYGTLPDDPAFLKSLFDALVSAGLLVDDSREWLEFVWPPTYERGAKQTTIELENIL